MGDPRPATRDARPATRDQRSGFVSSSETGLNVQAVGLPDDAAVQVTVARRTIFAGPSSGKSFVNVRRLTASASGLSGSSPLMNRTPSTPAFPNAMKNSADPAAAGAPPRSTAPRRPNSSLDRKSVV